jgi:hypothetical protein
MDGLENQKGLMTTGGAASARTAATAAAAGGDRPSFAGSEKDRQSARRVFTMTTAALNGRVSILHRAQRIEMISTIFAYILIQWHKVLN